MSDFITVVIRLPQDTESRKKITSELMLGSSFHGGAVTAVSTDDEITVIEMLEEMCDPGDCDRARQRAKQMHKAISETNTHNQDVGVG